MKENLYEMTLILYKSVLESFLYEVNNLQINLKKKCTYQYASLKTHPPEVMLSVGCH